MFSLPLHTLLLWGKIVNKRSKSQGQSICPIPYTLISVYIIKKKLLRLKGTVRSKRLPNPPY